jgi:hypothetical protein
MSLPNDPLLRVCVVAVDRVAVEVEYGWPLIWALQLRCEDSFESFVHTHCGNYFECVNDALRQMQKMSPEFETELVREAIKRLEDTESNSEFESDE